ncbi:hypothetical protein SAZ89_01370 [Limosilactobacillus reuteri]|nr:hypothetical protein [Limosilactobacillus reuteri]
MLTDYKHDFSIITIVNKEKVYQDFKKSLNQQQQVDYEVIKVNNDNNQFKSARKAYNEAAKKQLESILCLFILILDSWIKWPFTIF